MEIIMDPNVAIVSVGLDQHSEGFVLCDLNF